MEVQEAQLINDLRQRMISNEDAGKPPHFGITEDELKKAFEILRRDRRSAGESGSKPRAPVKVIDPFSLFADDKKE